jgi:hypothetical protein
MKKDIGYRERIKKAASNEEAKDLLDAARCYVSEKALKRCVRVFEQRKGK